MLHQSSPISKTAFDALQAKQSAVNAGYDVVTENDEVYSRLLHRMATNNEWTTKRQTPLVNAGYAARVRVISHLMSTFVKYHRLKHAQEIQIVLLGCGVDVIGLWGSSLDPIVTVIELDMADVCRNKREILCQQKMVEPVTTSMGSGQDPGEEVLIGVIRPDEDLEDLSQRKPNYVLCPVDLRELSTLDQVAEEYLKKNTPTLAISELVLAYLADSETDDLLRWCSLHLCSFPGSIMAALEPLGHEKPSNSNYISVVEGYKSQYCQSFGSKMDKGKSKHVNKQSTTKFSPIASTLKKASTRFLENGWNFAHATSLGMATTHAVGQEGFNIPETFDEHAALTLHLKAYSVVYAAADKTEELLKRLICRSLYASTEITPVLSNGVAYTYIAEEDEIPMRSMFYDTYFGFFAKYPAIRKMMDGVMKSDMSMEPKMEGHSAIGERYQTLGGGFVVAVEYDKDTQARRLIGCVGIRKCEERDIPGTLEIFRMAVDSRQRGKGIGRNLLTMVENLAISKSCPKIIAQTLTILESAQRLYEKSGYIFLHDKPLGALVMKKYAKELKKEHK